LTITYTDVFKFQLSYSLNHIDIAVLVVPKQRFANLIDENVACYERVIRELPWAKMSLTLPILVIGIEPVDYSLIKKCYEDAGKNLVKIKQSKGEAISIIPFDARIIDEPSQEA
jgi:hypothetical protein